MRVGLRGVLAGACLSGGTLGTVVMNLGRIPAPIKQEPIGRAKLDNTTPLTANVLNNVQLDFPRKCGTC
jgi:hypothetical protein